MKRSSTHILRAAVLLFGLVVLVLCVFALPAGLRSPNVGGYKPILIGMYITAVPFYIALFQTLRLLSYIDTNRAFSQASIKALNIIKYCAFSISALYAIGAPQIHYMVRLNDAPGVMFVSLVCTFGSLAIGVFAGLLARLFQDAITIKQENDQTV